MHLVHDVLDVTTNANIKLSEELAAKNISG